MSDDHYNMILGAVIVGIILMGIFLYLFFNGYFNGLGRGHSSYEDCQLYVAEHYQELADDCKMDYPELIK